MKYGPRGLVVLSVSAEEERQDRKHQEAVLEFLKKMGAAFPNYVLDEPSDVWAEKLGSGLRPIVFVFNRDGRWKRFDATDFDEDGDRKLEKLIEEWLQAK